MLNLERTQEKIKATHLLITGRKISPDLHQMIYDRIKDGYLNDDLDKALSAMEGDENPRFSWPILIKKLMKYKTMRMETEWANEKLKDKQAHENMENRNPELAAMLDAILNKDAAALSKYNLDREWLVSNAIVIGKDGRRRKMIIDPNQEGFRDAITQEKVQTGSETMALVSTIDLSKIEYIEIDEKRETRPDLYVVDNPGWKTRKVPDKHDPDFIPELDF